MITSVFPVGAQRGSTAEIEITGQGNFAGAYAVFFEGKAVTAEVVTPSPAPDPAKAVNSIKLRVNVGADANLGPREFRVLTPRGSSTVAQLVIGSEPEAFEKEGNNLPAEATAVELPAVLNGKLQAAEDVDHFRFHAQAGEQVVFSCLCGRLQDKMHDLSPGGGGMHTDPMLVLLDAEGRELAAADDYWGPDPLLSFRFPKEGDYVLQIRDVRYAGHATWSYRVVCTQKPYLTAVFPMGGRKGEMVQVQPVGFNLGPMGNPGATTPVRVPEGMEPGTMDLQLDAGGSMTNPLPFVVSEAPQFLETEPNDTFDAGTLAELPGGWNGRIEKDNDLDCFRFPAEKGKTYSFEVFSRRYGTTLDSVIQILDATGKSVARNDDFPGVHKDSRLDWTCPADGSYALQVGDLNSRGGPTSVYYVSATPGRPDFTLQADDDKALIGPGSGYAMYVIAQRRNGFDGEIKLTVENLPPGVTAFADRIPAGMNQGCVIFRAATDVKPDFRRIRMWGTGMVQQPDGVTNTLRREVVPMQEIYMPGGGRTPYPVDTHIISTTEPSDVLLKLSTNRVSLTPGSTATIEVDVVRQKNYDKNVVLDVYLRHLGRKYGDPLPPGISLDEDQSKTLLGPKETKGKIVLKAAPSATPVENLPIAVLGQISINFVVKVSHSSEPLLLTVTKQGG
jgi:hypothetical protein